MPFICRLDEVNKLLDEKVLTPAEVSSEIARLHGRDSCRLHGNDPFAMSSLHWSSNSSSLPPSLSLFFPLSFSSFLPFSPSLHLSIIPSLPILCPLFFTSQTFPSLPIPSFPPSLSPSLPHSFCLFLTLLSLSRSNARPSNNTKTRRVE